jgi:hypothetical protein
MPDYQTIKFVYNNLMAFDPLHGIFPVEGEEYVLKYEEIKKLEMPVPTGGYRIDADGRLIKSSRIEITGNSYISVNRATGEFSRVDSRYGTTIDRHDDRGRDLVEIIKKSIVEWTKIS